MKQLNLVAEDMDKPRSKEALSVTRGDLDSAAGNGVISHDQAGRLWDHLMAKAQDRPRLDLPNVAWYFGSVLVLLAMGWFMVELWDRMGSAAIVATSAAYGLIFGVTGKYLWSNKGLKVPGGLLTTLAVFMTPLAVIGLEQQLGLWDSAHGSIQLSVGLRFLVEFATVVAGLIALRLVRFPFITLPVVGSLWLMTGDVTALAMGVEWLSGDQYRIIGIIFGVVMIGLSFVVDRRTREDFSFWGYLFGAASLWISLAFTLEFRTELKEFLFFMFNVGFMLASVLVGRRIFLVFGALGSIGYFFHLVGTVFTDSLGFAFALTVLGAAIIAAGIYYHRNRQAIENKLRGFLPESVRKLLPK